MGSGGRGAAPDLLEISELADRACSEDPTYPPGSLVGSYWVEGVIGAGGTACVYRAKHARIGRRVALKALQGRYAHNPEVVERFFSEAKAANAIDHENIVQVTDFVEDRQSGTFYFVMELLEGFDLRELVRLEGALEPERAVRIAVQIADALVAAHAVGVVHRDLKPENVYLVESERRKDFVKIIDFGVAKLAADIEALANAFASSEVRTAPGALVGTPAYMSPEQLSNDEVDHLTDIYAFGLVLYEMLAGAPPFGGSNFADLVVSHKTEAPQPLHAVMDTPESIPGELEDLVLACLAKKREDRPQSMLVILEELVAIASQVGWSLDSSLTTVPVAAGIEEGARRSERDATLRLARADLVEATRPSATDVATVERIDRDLVEATKIFAELGEELGTEASGGEEPELEASGGEEPELEATASELDLGGVESLEQARAEVASFGTVPASPGPPEEVRGEAASRSGRTWGAVAVIAALLVGGGVAAAMALGRGDGAAEGQPFEPGSVVLVFRSEPAGAEVYLAGEDRPIGRTPFEKVFEANGSPVTVELRKTGYEPVRRTVELLADGEVAAALVPTAAERQAGPDAAARPEAEVGEPEQPAKAAARPAPRERPGRSGEKAPGPPSPGKAKAPVRMRDLDSLVDPYGS